MRQKTKAGRSMAFRVEISPEAFENLDTVAAYI